MRLSNLFLLHGVIAASSASSAMASTNDTHSNIESRVKVAKQKIKRLFRVNKQTKTNQPLYDYGLNRIKALYDAQSLTHKQTLELFRNAFTTVTHLGDMIVLSQAKGYGVSSEVGLDAGKLIFPFFSLKTVLAAEGSAMRQKFGVVERRNIDVNSSDPYPYALYKMYGFSTEVSGGAGVEVGVSPIPSAVQGVMDKLESVNIAMEASVSVNASAKGRYLYVDKASKKSEFYSSIIGKNRQGKLLAASLLDFAKSTKNKHSSATSLKKWFNNKRNKTGKDNNHIRIWEAGGNANADAGIEIRAQVKNSIGAEAKAMSNVDANISYIHYDIQTIDSNNVAKIQNTGFVLKQVGASLKLSADAALEVAQDMKLKENRVDKVKEFTFINSIQYKGPVYFKDLNKDKILYGKSYYVVGQSVSIPAWRKFFIDDVMDYSSDLTKSPYVQMLAKKFHAEPARIVNFLKASSTVLNEALYNEGIEPSAFLIEASYSVSNEQELMDGKRLSDSRIAAMKIRYRLADDVNNNREVLKLGFNAGIAEFEIGLNKIEEAGSIEVIDLYDDSTNAERGVAYSLLY